MPERSNSSKKKGQSVDLDTLGLEMGNKPPQALDFEEAVLGAVMVEPDVVDEAVGELQPNCFYDPRHRAIFETIAKMASSHNPIDLLTVSRALKDEGKLEDVGGPVALAAMTQRIGAAARMDYYIKILKQKAIQRELITASYSILKDSYDDSINVDDLISASESRIYKAVENSAKKEAQDIGSILADVMNDVEKRQKNIGGVSGVPSGFGSLDKLTMGWQPSDLVILAARPSVGKTAFALNLCRNAAVDHNRPVAFFSLEMSARQLGMRLMTTESGLSANKLKGSEKMEDYEWAQLDYQLKNLNSAPIYVDDTPSLPIMEFRSKVNRLVKSKKVELVIVDYLQLMQGPSDLKGGIREQEVAAISRILKATAKEYNVPIIALSQLSRASVTREGAKGKPQLSDLRESGSIEQDADIVMFIHRPDYVGMSENVGDREYTEVIIAKHRNGPVDTIKMLYKSDQVRFVEANDTLVGRAEDGTYEAGATLRNDDGGYNPVQEYGGRNDEFNTNSFE